MAIYAIGDIQGCDHELGQLIHKLRFSADRDLLWFVGDLINRGPDSLAVLRRLLGMKDNTVVTLGNHDLHLMAIAFGAPKRKSDTLDAILEAPDFDVLLEWLISRPFMHEDVKLGLAMVHAGLPPQWDIAVARACARLAQSALRDDPQNFVAKMYGSEPTLWDEKLSGADRLRFVTNCFTRLRYVDAMGRLNLREKAAPSVKSGGLRPWFEHREARWRGTHIVFGHWSTLGFFRNAEVTGLDTGCGWGDRLTALRVDVPDAQPVSVGCTRYVKSPG